MTACRICGRTSRPIASALEVCGPCIRSRPGEAEPFIREAHRKSRTPFDLPPEPPRDSHGAKCTLCVNACSIPEGAIGYCGLRKNEGGKLLHLGGTPEAGWVDWYFDPLPTNCVADWVCEGRHEAGCNNLAVFYEACTFDCLFCQNWNFREKQKRPNVASAEELAAEVDPRTACICYFGGDPAAQLPHAIRTSEIAMERAGEGGLRVCWETNGSMHPALLEKMGELSMASGGCVKFDLKAWDETLHKALTGVTNRRTLENFKRLAARIAERSEPPLLVASTLLVPGYVDGEEVGNIARLIASLDPDIPYSLLAFHPQFFMSDLPTTSREQANACLAAAHGAGLTRVRIGNVHLLR